MSPVVMSTTYGEREAKLNLRVAWEILGGMPCTGMCGYIADLAMMEMNDDYARLIERKAENIYRTINQKTISFPASNQAVKQKVAVSKTISLTPQETEQLSQYASNENYVQQQKEDLQELASMFRGMMKSKDGETSELFVKDFKDGFQAQPGFRGVYKFVVEGKSKALIIKVDVTDVDVYYGDIEKADVTVQITENVLGGIVAGRMSFQRAFMAGEMTMKGDFGMLRALDQIFVFIK